MIDPPAIARLNKSLSEGQLHGLNLRPKQAGTIVSVTNTAETADAYRQIGPVWFALVRFDDGFQKTLQLTDTEGRQPKIDDRVEIVMRRYFAADQRSPIVYGPKVRLINE